MKGLVLSGGRGTRLRPLTYSWAKQLVPVMNKPILFYGLEALVAAGITQIGIVVGDTRHEIMAAVGDGRRFGATVTYIEQAAPLGLAHAVAIAEDYLGTEPFLMYLGDNLICQSLAGLVRRFVEEKPNAQILLAHVPNPQEFGVAELRQGQVVRLLEKPAVPPSDLALVGVYLFDASIFDAVKSITPSRRGELEITDAIQWLIEAGFNVLPHVISGWWKDTGKLEDLLEANHILLETIAGRVEGDVDASELFGEVIVEAGAKIRHSVIRGPVVIGRDAVIERAAIGPFTAIGDRVLIRASEVARSIILDGSSITEVAGPIESSVVGRDVTIYRADDRPRAHHLMLGDRAHVGLA